MTSQEALRRLRVVFPDAAEDALKAAFAQHLYLAPTISALYQQLLLRPTSRAATYGRRQPRAAVAAPSAAEAGVGDKGRGSAASTFSKVGHVRHVCNI